VRTGAFPGLDCGCRSGLRWPRAGVVSTTKPSGEQSYPSRRAGCIKRTRNAAIHWTEEGRPTARRSCQRMSNKQQQGHRGRLSVCCWCAHGAPCCGTFIGSPSDAPVTRGYCATQARGEPRAKSTMTCRERGFFDLYVYRPCIEGSATFFPRKTASTALKAIAGCRGGYRERKAGKGCRGHRLPQAVQRPRRRHGM
jgi:hypothetical protein